ncbi:BTB/POZ domain-containing protein [Nymphaea thermarum]|nr:BTB/POZ domain-containing protein [Nymphaea thermarum]
MDVVCDLEVDVNGESRFFVDKRILSSFSGKLCQLFQKSSVPVASICTRPLKIILHDFPGGSEAFELLARFCYNKGKIHMIPSNVCLLHWAANFMEMKEEVHSNNLIEQTERSLRGVAYWNWAENLVALKQCQELIPAATSSGILQKIIDSMLLKITSNSESSPSNSSPESSVRLSCDTKSSELSKNSGRVWWFEDLYLFNSKIIGKMVITMVNHKFDHVILSRFLFGYLKSQLASSTPTEKLEATETVVNLLSLLEKSSVSSKGLFAILRMTSGLATDKSCRDKLVAMIGSRLDQASLDNLLLPAPTGMGSLYDVNLVLRFLKSFLGGDEVSPAELMKVGFLMDKYIAEVAPDSCLKPSKFSALVRALPDSARESYDEIYRALDMYLQAHSGLSEEEKMKVCSVLNHEKLSLEVCKHIAQNSRIPSRAAIQAVVCQQSKLKTLLESSDNQHRPTTSSPPALKTKEFKAPDKDAGNQIVLFAEKLDLSTENEKLKARLQGMQWKVMELEKMCRKMQTDMSKIMKSKVGSHGSARLPRLCS